MTHRALVRILILLIVWSGSLLCGVAQPMTNIFIDSQLVDSVLLSSSKYQEVIDAQLRKLWREGYMYSGLDSMVNNRIYVHRGEQFDRKKLSLTIQLDDEQIHYHRVGDYHKVIDEQINYYNESGYPFAKVKWDSVKITSSGASGWLTLRTGPKIVFDSIHVSSELQLSVQFLESLLGFRQGEPYKESVFQNISLNLQRVSFIKLLSKPELIIKDGKASIILDLEANPKNRFEGIVGVFPSQSSGSQTQINGFLNLELANLFRSAKEFSFHWEKFGNQSQELDLSFINPMFLGTAVNLRSSFQLTKQDTTFLYQDWSLEGGTFIYDALDFSIGYNKQSSSIISSEVLNQENQLLDYTLNNYLISLRSPQFGTPLLFRDFHFQVITSFGNKNIERNINIDSEKYDSLEMKTAQATINLSLNYLIKLKKKSGWYQMINFSGLFGKQILTNELFRLGGLQTVRGFNERVFYAKKHLLSRQEFRQYFDNQSYFLILYDFGVFQEINNQWNTIHGFGAGINLNTSNGFFNFVVAAGKIQSIPLDLTDLKIHFGYTSVF